MNPNEEFPTWMPFTSQITTGARFCTVAANCCDPPATMLGFAGETLTCATGDG